MLRASVFGVSDGLVSNLALVMGVAGGSLEAQTVVLAGWAGLLAGACSMAAGEYVSMQTQREMLERELRIERDHIERFPRDEEEELAALLAESGLDAEDAQRMAAQIHRRQEHAIHFHAQLELGINPGGLGSPLRASLSSFVCFAGGALIPLLPWILVERALPTSIAVSAAALLAVGALATRVTHVRPWWGATRQLLVGAVSASVTYAVGVLIGRAAL